VRRCGEVQIIAFINDGLVIRKILGYLGEPTSAPRIVPARGPSAAVGTTGGQAMSMINASPGRGDNDEG